MRISLNTTRLRIEIIAISTFCLLQFGVFGQSETSSFNSLVLPVHASVAALGGVNVSKANAEASYFLNNPSLAGDSLNGWLSVGHLFYFANIGFSTFAFQDNFRKIGALTFGVTHLSLGQIQGYDAVGNPTSTFNSGESSIVVGKSHQVNAFRLGVNLKGIFSNLGGYRASALALDIGGVFIHPQHDWTVGLAMKNIGVVLSDYSPTSTSSLPFDIQTSMTYKPEHMPVRFTIGAFRLTNYDLPNSASDEDKPNALDKVTSHLTFGGELLIHRNVSVLLGYNFLRHKELKLSEAGGGSGFSIGASAKVKNFNLAFSRAGYVTTGAYQVSIGVNTNKILKRK